MANSSLSVSSLDFDTLKANFIQYLTTQTAFKDYNFEGSNMNVLLDVMSYNTYLNSFYLNMVASEMFLDTAQKLDSVISHAKELNYVPKSTRSAKAVVSFTIDTTDITNPFIIPKNTNFSGINSNGSFSFVTNQENSYLSTDTYIINNIMHTIYTISNLEIYEGSYVQDAFVVDDSQETQRFILSNANVDTNSITVSISEDDGVSNTYYTLAENLYGLNGNSQIYFIQATFDQNYELIFGDNIFGKKPINGSIIYAEYIASSGSEGNGVTNFNLDTDLGSYNGGFGTVNTFNVVSASVSGADFESIESIKYNAPRHYQTQGRCVTSNDYKTTILQNFPEIEYVNVFGGTVTNTAVEYGKVYISPSTYSGTVLTESRKSDIKTFVDNLSPIGIVSTVIDPDYLYIDLTSEVSVNFKNTSSSASVINSKIINSISMFNSDNLQNFDTTFRLSKLEQAINDTDISILSNQTYINIYRSFSPALNIGYAINCDLQNAIRMGTITSSQFNSYGITYIFTDYIEGVDTGSGIIYQLEINPLSSIKNYTKAGIVEYSTGNININQTVYSDIGGGVEIYATPVDRDIKCYRNSIMEIDTISGLNITIVSE